MAWFDMDTAVLSGWEAPQERTDEMRRVAGRIRAVLDGPEDAVPEGSADGVPVSRSQRLTDELRRWIAWKGEHGDVHARYISEGVRTQRGVVEVRNHAAFMLYMLRRRLLAGDDVEAVLDDATICLVTPDEHRRLLRFQYTAAGWDRYARAGIRVWDRARGDWLAG